MYVAAVSILFFLAILITCFVAVLIASEVLERRAKSSAGGQAIPTIEDESGLFREEVVSTISPWASLLQKFDFIEVIRVRTAEAELDWSVGRTCAMMLLAATITLALLSGVKWMPGLLVVLLSGAAGFGPYVYILRKRAERFSKFESLFPDALDSMCRALRAGHPFAAGMELLSAESVPPVSNEIRKTLEEWKLGMSWGQALDNLALRMPVIDVAIFVAAVKLQMRTGGRLGEALTKLAESMRENAAIRGEVKALAAHGKLTGTVLTLLPVGIAAVMMYVNPSQMAVLFEHPIGKNLVTGALACLVVAHFVIRKIVDIHI